MSNSASPHSKIHLKVFSRRWQKTNCSDPDYREFLDSADALSFFLVWNLLHQLPWPQIAKNKKIFVRSGSNAENRKKNCGLRQELNSLGSNFFLFFFMSTFDYSSFNLSQLQQHFAVKRLVGDRKQVASFSVESTLIRRDERYALRTVCLDCFWVVVTVPMLFCFVHCAFLIHLSFV